MKEKKFRINTKAVRKGSYSLALIAVAVAAAVCINVLAAHLPERVNSVDLSANNLYSIGEQTRGVLDSLDKEVNITVLADEEQAEKTLVKLLSRYEDASDKVSVEYTDLTKNLDLSDKYSDLTAGSVVVTSGEKERAVDLADIFVTDYSTYYSTGNMTYSFDGEGQITSAIAYVTSESLPKLYTVVGHGETPVGSLAAAKIRQQNIETADLNLLAVSSIPEDADCILINAPQADYTEEEAQQVLDYLEKGGKVLLFNAYSKDALPHFHSILTAYGIAVEDGIVMESANHYFQYPIYVIATPVATDVADITTDILANKDNILLPYATGFTKTDVDGVQVTELLASSDGAYSKKPDGEGTFATLEKESGDVTGRFGLAYLATPADATEEAGALIAVSTASLIDDSVNSSFSLGNLDLFGNCLSYLCSDEDQTVVAIPTKSMSRDLITVPELQTLLWAALTVLVIPAAVLIAGLVVWLRRRKK